jgi:hypothetical protein
MAWAPDYTTTEDLAAFVRIGDTLDDSQLALAVSTASRAIDQACGRQFGRLTVAAPRFYTARWEARRCRWTLHVDDLMDLTGLVVAYDTNDDQSYSATISPVVPLERNAAADGRPWTRLEVHPSSAVQPCERDGAVRVTALWGWTAVPAAVEQACLLQASRLLARRDSPFGVAGSPEVGSEVRLLSRLDPDVAVAVRPYRRMWGAV